MPMYDIHPIDAERIENTFTYHKPFGNQPERYELLREVAKSLAYGIISCCPPSRERSLALTHLEDVVFNANAAIARNEKESVNTDTQDNTNPNPTHSQR